MMFKKIFFIFVIVCLFPSLGNAEFRASFNGSRLDGLSRYTTAVEWNGDTDGSGNLVDKIENLEDYSEDYTGWTWTAERLSILPNQYKNPLTQELNAGVFVEDDTASDTHILFDDYYIEQIEGHRYTASLYARSINRNWIYFYESNESTGSYFDLSHCTVGTANANTLDPMTHDIDGTWCRVMFSWVSSVTDYNSLSILVATDDLTSVYDGILGNHAISAYGLTVVDNTAGVSGPGKYYKTGENPKVKINLTPHGSPPSVASDLQDVFGNKIRGRSFNKSTQYYDHSNDSNLDVWGSDSTTTIVFKANSIGSYMQLWRKIGAAGGAEAYIEGGGTPGKIYVGFCDNFLCTDLYFNDPIVAGTTYVLQVVRDNDDATAYLNGVSSGTFDVDGYGLPSNSSFYLGAKNGVPTYPFDGTIIYFRIDAEALSAKELSRQREQIWAILTSDFGLPSWNFSRSTSAYTTFSDGTISKIGSGIPRVSDGILIEGPSTNYAYYTEYFDAWDLGEMTVSANSIVAPDGTLTADGLISSSVAGQHYVRIAPTFPSGDLQWSIFAKKGARNWLYLNSSSYSVDAYFNVDSCTVGTSVVGNALSTEKLADGWCRCSASTNYVAGGVGYIEVKTAEADGDPSFAGDDVTVDIYVWGIQVEPGKFTSSYIQNLGYVVSTTRTAESFSMPVHSTGKDVLPNYIGVIKQLHGLTETFDSWANSGGCIVTANSSVAPDGTMTADLLDNTGATTGDMRYIGPNGLGSISGRTFTRSVWVRSDTTHLVTLRSRVGVDDFIDYITSTPEWTRVSVTHTFTDAATSVELDIYPGKFGTNTGAAYFWGANFTETSVLQGYIPNAGIETSTITKNLTSTKLSIEFLMKCEWNSGTNIGTDRTVFEISGSTWKNRVSLEFSSSAHLYWYFRDNSSVEHYVHQGGLSGFGNWHKMKFFVDFSDLSRMNSWIDGSASGMSYSGNSGTAVWDTTGAYIRGGADYLGTVNGFCKIKEPIITEYER